MKRLLGLVAPGIVLLRSLSQAPPTIEQSLTKAGVGTSKVELITALRDPRPEVRGMAAVKLAENKDFDSEPAIVAALDVEQIPIERLNIARALGLLDNPRARETQIDICTDHSVRSDLRLAAANDMGIPDKKCASSVVEMLAEATNPAEQNAELLYLLEKPLASLGEFVSPNLFATAIRVGLEGQFPFIRIAAAKCAEKYKLQKARVSLQAALQHEDDEDAKAAMQSAIKRLDESAHN